MGEINAGVAHAYRPTQLTANYGKALNTSCSAVNATAFSRAYERATVTLDCERWTATIG